MKRIAVGLCLVTASAFGQYKLESAGAAPAELAPAIREALQKDGARIVGANGAVFCEVWMRTKAPSGGKTTEENVTYTQIPHGSVLGAIRFPQQGVDRRGQPIKAGVYTLRLSFYPVDGAHQGVAATRDFLLLVPAGADTELNSTPNYEQVVKMSAAASGTPHPAVLSIWKPDSAPSGASLKKEGEDWVLYTTMGDTPVAILVVGVYAG